MLKRILALTLLLFCIVSLIPQAYAATGLFIQITPPSESVDGSISIGVGGETTGTMADSAKAIFTKYKAIAAVISGICVITAIISLFFQLTKLGASGDNEIKRRSAIIGILFSGGVLTAFGGLSILLMVLWNALG